MKKLVKILVQVGLIFLSFSAFADNTGIAGPVFITDRGFCASGDSVWLKYKLPELCLESEIVVRFQLEAVDGNIIESAAVVSKNGWAQGYLPVADSLRSGQYFITAFLVNQGNQGIQPVTKSLLVYNRFDQEISTLRMIGGEKVNSESNENKIEIHTNKNVYKPRDSVSFNLPAGFTVSEAVVKATLVDPLEKLTPRCNFKYSFSQLPGQNFIEKNGYLISGKVASLEAPQPGVLVVISLPALSGYFDYCVTDSTGGFNFFLKNGFGTADAIFQVFSASEKKFQLQLENGALNRVDILKAEPVVFTTEQAGFARNVLNSSFASHIFYPASLVHSVYFSMVPPDSIPFYGIPTMRVRPEEFIELPDFREISRELLHGFQYRVKNDKIVFRMFNRSKDEFFRVEPFRLINGIPVFDNQLFVSLKSSEIEHIDLVLTERIFGDLRMNGVIEVSLKDKSNAWLAEQPNLFKRKITLLQPSDTKNNCSIRSGKNNEPDTRQVFLWEKITGTPVNQGFVLSDRKGSVEISVEGFTADNQYFKLVKTIEVQ